MAEWLEQVLIDMKCTVMIWRSFCKTVAWAIFVSKGIAGFNVLRRKLIYSFMKSILTSQNLLIQAIV